jgi:hypothetical protein
MLGIQVEVLGLFGHLGACWETTSPFAPIHRIIRVAFDPMDTGMNPIAVGLAFKRLHAGMGLLPISIPQIEKSMNRR